MGVEEIVFVATLDHRTSEVCQHADGERIKLVDAVAGENIPPLHPNCRSTIRAYIGDDFEPTERWDNAAQDVIARTGYQGWADIYSQSNADGKADAIGGKKFSKEQGVAVVDLVTKYMSGYGKIETKPAEFFAESFVNYAISGKYRNIWGDAMESLLKNRGLI